ncbi:tail fiber domain-containing protein [Levilactobacillus brevis]|uniref:tail fiber domain-containing protein n=1 Tax=Levilactobacillus brevis TaxID=1580 RepID=UPI001BACABD0|nr:tail fiber domain-containing protein [Levilactobacillus brevis]MBS1006931.1 tail fiber domain-containing protein [Levilactobacillus brevis]
MIIATGSVDINEATLIAQTASKSTDDLADKMKNTVATMDGKTTVSTSTPFDDGKEHNEGDMWTVINDDVASAMYIYTNGSWQIKKWDQEALSVKQLSALTADLGHVTAGTLESAIINGAQINGGTVTGSCIDQDFTSSDGNHYQLWADYNGFHYRVTRSSDGMVQDMRMTDGGFTVKGSGTVPTVIAGDSIVSNNITGTNVTAIMNLKGNTVSGSSVSGNGLSISGHTIACDDSGQLWFETNGGGGQKVADIRAGVIYSNGTALKSALSAKRDVTEYSPDEALSAVMSTDVKKWKYKDSDNSADSQHIGPIIDDVNEVGKKSASIANDMISTDENGNYYLNESNTISILLAALKKSNQRIDELSYRIAQLERKNAQ